MNFTDVAAFLFERKPEGSKPQIVLADKNKVGMAWIPGNRIKLKKFNRDPVFYGLTPGAFYYPEKPQHSQPCYICWAGADFDLETKGDLQLVVSALYQRPEINVRLSGSGKGIHAFLRFDKPVEVHTRAQRSQLCKSVWAPYLQHLRLESLVDKYDYRAFYVSGGLNKWLVRSNQFIQAPILDTTPDIPEPVADFQGELDEAIQKIVEILNKAGVSLQYGRNNVYIKHIHQALQNTDYRFSTKSTMRDGVEPHTNGFIDLTPTTIEIIPNADGHSVLTIRGKGYFRNQLMGKNRKNGKTRGK